MEHVLDPNQKFCSHCQEWLDISCFDKKSRTIGIGRKVRLQAYCRPCSSRRNTEYKRAKRHRDPEYCARHKGIDRERVRRRENARRIAALTNPEVLVAVILRDSKKTCRKRGLSHTLTTSDILRLVTRACAYCGDATLRMSLDRIDNDRGYTLDNVIGACVRCNYMRRDIPYDAWLLLVPAVKESLSRGLLNGWLSGPHNKKRRRLAGAAGIEPT